MWRRVVIFILTLSVGVINSEETYRENSTTITSNNVTAPKGRIILKEVSQPHNLFVGRCRDIHPVVHLENFNLVSDGKSQVSGNIRIDLRDPVNITCVKIFDEDPEASAYPSYVAGGLGYNFIEFHIFTAKTKGFRFHVKIHGLKTTSV